MTEVEAAIRERVDRQPDAIWDCEACGGVDSMELRRSSLNDGFMADDVGLKCSECRHFRTHGIPFSDPEAFEAERERRDGRVYDFARDRDYDPAEQLRDLGYTGKAEDV